MATLERLHAQLHLNSANHLRAMDQRAALAKQLADADPVNIGGRDALSERLAKRKQELRELRRNFSDKYPDVVRLTAEIVSLERDLAEGRAGAGGDTPPPAPADPGGGRLKAALGRVDSEIDTLKAEEERLRR